MNKIYYGNMINLSGLYSKTPIKCEKLYGTKYWNNKGDFFVDPNELGIIYEGACIRFTSENENEVKIWTDGVLSTLKMLQTWCK